MWRGRPALADLHESAGEAPAPHFKSAHPPLQRRARLVDVADITTIAPISPDTPCAGSDKNALSLHALQLYLSSAHGLETRSNEVLPQAKKASRMLMAAALGQTMIGGITVSILADYGGPPAIRLFALTTLLVAATFWGLYIWSRTSPLGAAISGLLIYLTLWGAQLAHHMIMLVDRYGKDAPAHSRLSMLTVARWFIVVALIRAIVAGVKHRRLQQKLRRVQQADAPLAPLFSERRIAGIGTSVALFLGLLYMSLNLLLQVGTEVASQAEAMQLVAKIIFADTVLVLVWSIANWRDVYRPLARPVHPAWYFAAMAGGVVTFLVAQLLLGGIRTLVNIPITDSADPWQAAGYGLEMTILMVAVQPAIIEEIAFRGIIHSGMSRTLSGAETVIVTALMFMVLHLSITTFPHLLVIGLVLGAMRYKSGSWLPGVFLHFVHNFLCIML